MNGAGNATLMNILTGIYQTDGGEIAVGGYPVSFASRLDAIAAHIDMVHQQFKLVQAFSVAKNVHLSWSEIPARIASAALETRTASLAAGLWLVVNPSATVADLSTSEQQRVEILRILAPMARALILYESTAVLTPSEAQDLFVAMRTFVAQVYAVIFIRHKLDKVIETSTRVTVLRGRLKVATAWTNDCTDTSLAQMMVGREIVLTDMRGARPGLPVLRLEGVGLRRGLADISLSVQAGEILGIAGVAGNGQRELTQVMPGLRQAVMGRAMLGDTDITRADASAVAWMGVGHIPEHRLASGLAPALSVTDNAVLRKYDRPPLSQGLWYAPRAALALA